eukprot:CFRG0393T1
MTLLCSINYWRHPTWGWRRNIDIAVAVCGLISHLWWSTLLTGVYLVLYLIFLGSALSCYKQARSYGQINRIDIMTSQLPWRQHLLDLSLQYWSSHMSCV